jgi:hypothetical protein
VTAEVGSVNDHFSSSASTALSLEERPALMVDREVHRRADKRHAALLKRVRLKYPQACIEDVDGRAGRGFEEPALTTLALSRWVEDAVAVLVTGPTGSGKSWLACALAQYACRRGQSALYLRVPRLAGELRLLHGNGGFTRWLAAVARNDPPQVGKEDEQYPALPSGIAGRPSPDEEAFNRPPPPRSYDPSRATQHRGPDRSLLRNHRSSSPKYAAR